ncbi:MAG: hemopexin repeat-containing protein, partial [Acidimicrobiales bacterium]|nr:hemopexin repeat-containing protein [Acidimicrobiales bacterium]
GKIYFFKGSQYVRFSNVSDGVDPGYPKPIAGSWPGMPASFNSGIDAALMRKDNQKIYFFKGRTYVRFSSVSDGVDPGYPAWIDGNWMPFPR